MSGEDDIEDDIETTSEGDGEATDDALATIAGQLNLVNANLTIVTAELLANGGWQQGGKKSPEAFLVWKIGVQ